MNAKMLEQLAAIRDRYFRPVVAFPEGHLCHHGDCETHRSMEVYRYAPCTCGLLHDLRMLDSSVARKILPSLRKDHAKQDAMIPGHRYWSDEPEQGCKKAEEFLAKHFGVSLAYVEDDGAASKEWGLIEEVFGREFRDRMELVYSKKKG